ncbi:hypothetical protein DFA_09842 [Cavenderia fasciculata]|uniref:Transmembrane protein n=1 Tax=Cavenderia fasciculata TaxID=261658 RepID=F4QAW1_CACFS|nr:uncharacterized protein DFA_09842 [Cavenderia fasciculata]EGG15020.1 hypothetical protein DFA_09842 [Cavenderia fasciculata]|eukprot:XP_004351740.1 hypothetical protein DFA_09842 [Cavenderia fasciculata]
MSFLSSSLSSMTSFSSSFSLSKSLHNLFNQNNQNNNNSPKLNIINNEKVVPWKYSDTPLENGIGSIEMEHIQLSSYKLNASKDLVSSGQLMIGTTPIESLDIGGNDGGDGRGEEKKIESTLYSCEKNGWQGWKTIRIIGERYVFGLIVTISVSILIFIMSSLKWSGDAKDSSGYLNRLNYSIFFICSMMFFGTIYISLGFCASYSFSVLKKSGVLYYVSTLSVFIIIFYAVLTYKEVDFWYYYIDALGVVALFVIGQVLFSYQVSATLLKEGQETTQTKNQLPPTPDMVGVQQSSRPSPPISISKSKPKEKSEKRKAVMIAFNYTAPDVVVTIFSVFYMFFLLPIYFSIDNPIIRLGWRLLVHPLYWALIIAIARQFLTKDISTNDILLNSNIVLHTFFHSHTLGKIFVFTLNDEGWSGLTEIAMIVSAVEDIIIRCVSLKRDEFIIGLFYGREAARQSVYLQQNLQLRAAILNIQVALEFSGLITAPLFIYLFQQHRLVFHFFDGGDIVVTTLIYQTILSLGLDLISELLSTYVECRFFHLPISFTWEWMKGNKWFLAWLTYGALTMGLLGMIWLCCRTPRAILCTKNDICSCNAIIASTLPSWCNQD